MAASVPLGPKDDAVTSDHLEVIESHQARKESFDRPTHDKRPVWEQGRTYGPSGKISPSEERDLI
jgi:hypothetical protein